MLTYIWNTIFQSLQRRCARQNVGIGKTYTEERRKVEIAKEIVSERAIYKRSGGAGDPFFYFECGLVREIEENI